MVAHRYSSLPVNTIGPQETKQKSSDINAGLVVRHDEGGVVPQSLWPRLNDGKRKPSWQPGSLFTPRNPDPLCHKWPRERFLHDRWRNKTYIDSWQEALIIINAISTGGIFGRHWKTNEDVHDWWHMRCRPIRGRTAYQPEVGSRLWRTWICWLIEHDRKSEDENSKRKRNNVDENCTKNLKLQLIAPKRTNTSKKVDDNTRRKEDYQNYPQSVA